MNGITNPDFLKSVDLLSTLVECAPHELADLNRQIAAILARYMPQLSSDEKLMAEQTGVSLSEFSLHKARVAAAARADESLTDGERALITSMGVSVREYVALRDGREAARVALSRLPSDRLAMLTARADDPIAQLAEATASGWVTR